MSDTVTHSAAGTLLTDLTHPTKPIEPTPADATYRHLSDQLLRGPRARWTTPSPRPESMPRFAASHCQCQGTARCPDQPGKATASSRNLQFSQVLPHRNPNFVGWTVSPHWLDGSLA